MRAFQNNEMEVETNEKDVQTNKLEFVFRLFLEFSGLKFYISLIIINSFALFINCICSNYCGKLVILM